jgi:hypothetical protein
MPVSLTIARRANHIQVDCRLANGEKRMVVCRDLSTVLPMVNHCFALPHNSGICPLCAYPGAADEEEQPILARWTEYLQEAGARARSEGRPRDGQQLLDDNELRLWLEGYDAMDAVIRAQLDEIAAGWKATKRRNQACPVTSIPGSTPIASSGTGRSPSGTPSAIS